jgi:hypothetical protein
MPRAYDLAMILPALREAHSQCDIAGLRQPDRSEEYNRQQGKMRVLEQRMEAIERLILEEPATNMVDAAVQLALLAPALRDEADEVDCLSAIAARTVAGVLAMILRTQAIDISALQRRSYSFDLHTVS